MEKLDDDAIAYIASYFQALAEPTRLKVLNTLRERECNVGEMAELLGCTTANISKHLTLLAKAGFVERETRGTSAYYRIADPAIFDLCELVCGKIGARLAGQAAIAARMSAQHRQ
jgi:DNA-binding transcriptional ArsR family regulator